MTVRDTRTYRHAVSYAFIRLQILADCFFLIGVNKTQAFCWREFLFLSCMQAFKHVQGVHTWPDINQSVQGLLSAFSKNENSQL